MKLKRFGFYLDSLFLCGSESCSEVDGQLPDVDKGMLV